MFIVLDTPLKWFKGFKNCSDNQYVVLWGLLVYCQNCGICQDLPSLSYQEAVFQKRWFVVIQTKLTKVYSTECFWKAVAHSKTLFFPSFESTYFIIKLDRRSNFGFKLFQNYCFRHGIIHVVWYFFSWISFDFLIY